MTPKQKQELLQFFKAVGQPERAKILGLAASRPHTVIELAELLELKEMDALNQLTKLQKAGLIVEKTSGTMPTYQLDTAALGQLQQIILEEEDV
jgi:predicted ArsR family transcriptional regulator